MVSQPSTFDINSNMTGYAQLPAGATLDVKPFKAHVQEEKLQHFKNLLDLSPIAPVAYENTNVGRKYGMERQWLENAKNVWLSDFDWRKQEDRINSFPNFKASVKDADGNAIELQFLALFSEKVDAIPIVFLHGWPGSICEFLDILDILKGKYSPKTLPYHVIVPSLPGYVYSSGPPVDKDYRIDTAAGALNDLMIGLGFGSGYLAQGGDLGSFMSRSLAENYEACKGVHLNMLLPPDDASELPMDESEEKAWQKMMSFLQTENAFQLEQRTKPATVGLVLSTSPLALLTYIGEKMLAWSDEDIALDKILTEVTLYWMTDTISRCFYHSRDVLTKKLPVVEKPSGFSLFAKEIIPVPKTWAAKVCNLMSYNQHEHGGHFAALERPDELLEDVEEYIRKVWKGTDKGISMLV